VAIVTKALWSSANLDVLWQLHRDASVHRGIRHPHPGIRKLSRAIEPGVATRSGASRPSSGWPGRAFPWGDGGADHPGVSDEGMGTVLEAARDAGATSAGYVLLRLPAA